MSGRRPGEPAWAYPVLKASVSRAPLSQLDIECRLTLQHTYIIIIHNLDNLQVHTLSSPDVEMYFHGRYQPCFSFLWANKSYFTSLNIRSKVPHLVLHAFPAPKRTTLRRNKRKTRRSFREGRRKGRRKGAKGVPQ